MVGDRCLGLVESSAGRYLDSLAALCRPLQPHFTEMVMEGKAVSTGCTRVLHHGCARGAFSSSV